MRNSEIYWLCLQKTIFLWSRKNSTLGRSLCEKIALTIHSDAPLSTTTLSELDAYHWRCSIASLKIRVELSLRYFWMNALRSRVRFLKLMLKVANHRSIENPIYLDLAWIKNGMESGKNRKQVNRRVGFLQSINFIYAAPVSLFTIVLSKSKSTKFIALYPQRSTMAVWRS